MNCCIDIGNTSYKVALFLNRNLISLKKYKTKRNFIKHLTEISFDNIVLSTVREKDNDLSAILKKQDGLVLSHDTKLPIDIHYSTPDTLGRDRIAACVGASIVDPGVHWAVIDAGTCTTLDWLDPNRGFMGGNIAPGIHMRLKAMHDYTAKLPLVEPEYYAEDGDSTTQALQNGAVWGAIAEIEHFEKYIRSKIKSDKLKTILTGGDAKFIAKCIDKEVFIEENLVLQGLNEILIFNAKS